MSDVGVDSNGAVRKKRIPKACASCRRSKLRCDAKKPCTRCIATNSECIFVEPAKDSVSERIEDLENDIRHIHQKIAALQAASSQPQIHSDQPLMNDVSPQASSISYPGRSSISIDQSPFNGTETPRMRGFETNLVSSTDLVTRGLVSELDAESWFRCFFEGCHRYVPVFSPEHDTYHSIRSRSATLFDTIITYGCRSALGSSSRQFQHMQSALRQRVSDLVLAWTRSIVGGIENVQALLILACYSDKGWLLTAIALRIAIDLGLPNSIELLLRKIMARKAMNNSTATQEEAGLLRAARTWCGLFNIDQIISLDGGKPPTVKLTMSSHRLRLLCSHPLRTAVDVRLFAQIELNVLRASTYANLSNAAITADFDDSEVAISNLVHDAMIDLDVWLDDWNSIIANQSHFVEIHDVTLTLLNMRIQHAWATMTLNLRALSASGVENIATMTTIQQTFAHAAKAAGDEHLRLLLTRTDASGQGQRGYIANFRYAMDFVWAKCAFSVLLILRLGMLLNDSIDALHERMTNAKELLAELREFNGSDVSYMRILCLSVEKFDNALKEMQIQQQTSPASYDPEGADNANSTTMRSIGGDSAAEKDFQTYVPKEFLEEWSFPGLDLCNVPLDWQNLFVDFEATF